MNILFRVDADQSIGLGHLIRCRSLARACKLIGGTPVFVGYFGNHGYFDDLRREFLLLDLTPGSQPLSQHIPNSWLRTSESDDCTRVIEALNTIKPWIPDWFVIDHYGISAIWHTKIRLAFPGVHIAVIDDLADRALDPDLLIDHNTFACDLASRYQSLLPTDREVSLCLGPQFALIDPFYAGFQGAIPPRHRLQRLLISLGGAGDVQLLEKILHALVAMPIQGLQIQLVEGGFARESFRVQALCQQLKVQRLSSLPSLAPLMASADAAIGAGGTTTWERLCLGLPCITYALAENQEEYSKVLADRGLIAYLGRAEAFDEELLQRALLHFHDQPEHLQYQSAKGMELVDGQGCARIARLISSHSDPVLWSELSTQELDCEPFWVWSDGVRLSNENQDQKGPLRSVDRLQVNRNCSPPPPGYITSSLFTRDADSPISQVSVLSSSASWMNHYIPILIQEAFRLGCSVRWVHDHHHLVPGDVCFLLSYGRIVSEEWLARHPHNLVVHASALPQGKGWSPMTWQILEGSSSIPLTLFEAATALDAGPIYAQEMLQLEGHELAPEWQQLQAEATIRLCSQWLKDYPASAARAKPQQGEESSYGRRRPEDSRLDSQLSLDAQFPLLRVVDNEAYPAFFERHGRRYRLQIEPWC